jgi:hypothetical protein
MQQQTSLDAYQDILPTLTRRQDEIYRLLCAWGPLDNELIARSLNREINTITPRVKELRDAGIVIPAGIRRSRISGKNVNYWKVKGGDE